MDPRITFYCPSSELVNSVPQNPSHYWHWINSELPKFPASASDGRPITWHGPYGWTIQTWMYLRDGNYDVHLTDMIPDSGVVLTHSDFWPAEIEASRRQFFVEIKPDRTLRLRNPDVVIVQNPEDPIFDGDLGRRGRVFLIDYWPQNNLIRRNKQRLHLETACFMGNPYNFLSAPAISELKSSLRELEVEFSMPPRHSWNDYSNCDLVIAVRSPEHFSDAVPAYLSVRNKPATKLINSWLASVPAILSPEPSYERLRRSELDYIRARNVEEVISGVARLKDNPDLYQKMVENGVERSISFDLDSVKLSWMHIIRDGILPIVATTRAAASCGSYAAAVTGGPTSKPGAIIGDARKPPMPMSSERVHPLDPETLELFHLKSTVGIGGTAQKGDSNGLKVRRVMQITSDFLGAPFSQLKIIDFACGEGVYAIEAALRGAEVVALDGRTERMKEGVRAAERLGLTNVQFEQTDIRSVNIGSHGMFDVVFFLGILYHLDHRDVFSVLNNIYEMCRKLVVIDTNIALRAEYSVEHNGQRYDGLQAREHADDDSEEVRRSRVGHSLDNPLSFYFTKESLFRCLNDIGFTSVCECIVPLEPDKPEYRITVIATKGERVKVSSYPWVNDKSEDEIRRFLSELTPPPSS